LAQTLVSPGGTVEVSASPGLLPATLVCSVTSEDLGTGLPIQLYQELEFSTQRNFGVKSTFGSLEVEQCDDLDCIIDVTYTYTTTNVGEAAINITSFLRERDGDTADLTDLVDPKEIDVGGTTVLEEQDQVDYCVTSVITTVVQIFSEGEECAVNPVRRGLLRHKEDPIESVSVGKYDLSIDIQ
jgi:hypothetical protein